MNNELEKHKQTKQNQKQTNKQNFEKIKRFFFSMLLKTIRPKGLRQT